MPCPSSLPSSSLSLMPLPRSGPPPPWHSTGRSMWCSRHRGAWIAETVVHGAVAIDVTTSEEPMLLSSPEFQPMNCRKPPLTATTAQLIEHPLANGQDCLRLASIGNYKIGVKEEPSSSLEPISKAFASLGRATNIFGVTKEETKSTWSGKAYWHFYHFTCNYARNRRVQLSTGFHDPFVEAFPAMGLCAFSINNE